MYSLGPRSEHTLNTPTKVFRVYPPTPGPCLTSCSTYCLRSSSSDSFESESVSHFYTGRDPKVRPQKGITDYELH
jgi:hypothetical protein